MSDKARAYVVAQVEVTDAVAMRHYQRSMVATVAKAGGRIVAAGQSVHLEGERFPNLTVIIEFESIEVAAAWYERPDYQEVIPLRLASTSSSMVGIIPGLSSE